jgi:GDP-4-dehydro-6-deoxy-D-mannose reductase
MRILVTGSSGFVGKYLIKELNDQKVEIFEFDLQNGKDLLTYDQIRNDLETIVPDLIFHLAAQAYVPESTTNPNRGVENILKSTLNLLEAIRQLGQQPRVHIAGTSEEYGYDRDDLSLNELSPTFPSTLYGTFKLAATNVAQNYAKNYNLPIVITRAWNHFGPGSSPVYAISAFAKRIAMAEKFQTEVVHGNLDAIRNYTHVSDITKAYIKCINLESGIYNIASEYTVSLHEIFDYLISKASCKIKVKENKELFRRSSNRFPKPDVSKFQKLTGWETKISLNDGLDEMLEYWRRSI